MRLIDADALMRTVGAHDHPMRDLIGGMGNGMFTIGFQQAVDEQPTVDAEPVRHGAWERVEVIYPEENKNAVPGAIASMFCPVCKRWHSEVYFYGNPIEWVNYCNHCGAKMDEKENTDERD